MPKSFQRIGLIARQRPERLGDMPLVVAKYLQELYCQVVIEEETSRLLPSNGFRIVPAQDLNQHCDLLIVVGGDGSLLHAARLAVDQNLPVLGINRGRLGFLTDIHPEELEVIEQILNGNYQHEKRFLLTAQLEDKNEFSHSYVALNDVVLIPGKIVHMIEFDIYIDQQFVCSQRADGLIIATPTGSTAYALSGGGPILHPQLDAIALVPMFPHTLSSRPVVIAGSSEITIKIAATNTISPLISCDGQKRLQAPPGSCITIRKKPQQLHLIHPIDYNYFQTLRKKLHWQK